MHKRTRPVAFCSEHTATYAVLPPLIRQLERKFRIVLPVYFSATREASHVAFDRLPDSPGSAIAVFPRRPKLLHGGDTDIVVKFNQELFAYAFHAEREQIPVFAAVPIASTLQELAVQPGVAWFGIRGGIVDSQFVKIHREGAAFQIDNSLGGAITNIPDIATTLALVRRETPERPWRMLLKSLNSIRRLTYSREFSMFRRMHRPFVVLCA